MEKQISQTLDILRTQTDPGSAWTEIVSLCRAAKKRGPWDSLPLPDFARDVSAAREWLTAELERQPHAAAMAWGLDTLNMEDAGYNVQFAATDAGDSSNPQADWLFDGDPTYGGEHLIQGLAELREVYSRAEWADAFTLCDYILFLGYAGIVLAAVLREIPAERDLLVALGFWGGDLFVFARKTPQALTLICR